MDDTLSFIDLVNQAIRAIFRFRSFSSKYKDIGIVIFVGSIRIRRAS